LLFAASYLCCLRETRQDLLQNCRVTNQEPEAAVERQTFTDYTDPCENSKTKTSTGFQAINKSKELQASGYHGTVLFDIHSIIVHANLNQKFHLYTHIEPSR